jgi:hypothetical protein
MRFSFRFCHGNVGDKKYLLFAAFFTYWSVGEGLQQQAKMQEPHRGKSNPNSIAGTRTRVSCVKGKYASHLHHDGTDVAIKTWTFTV